MVDVRELLKLFPASKSALELDQIGFNKLNPSIIKLFHKVVDQNLLILVNEKEIPGILLHIESVLNYTWEQLHTGKWENVDIAWRQLYSYISLIKAQVCLKQPNIELKQRLINSIKSCDMGLIMGEPILDDLLTRIADSLNEALINLSDLKRQCLDESVIKEEVIYPTLDPSKSIQVFHQPSIETFLTEIMNQKPAIFTGNIISLL